MFRVLKSELYKSNRLGTYIINGIIVLGILLLALLTKDNGIKEHGIFFLTDIAFSMLPLFSLVYVSYFFEDNKYDTLKNSVSSSISKNEIYLGKFLNQVILLIISIVVALVSFVIIINIFNIGGNDQLNNILLIIKKLFISLPVYISLIALYDLVVSLFRKEGIAIFMCVIVIQAVNALSALIDYYGGKIAQDITPYILTNPLKTIIFNNNITNDSLNKCLIGGVASLIIYLAIGIIVFNKRDIK
ncbi:ABC transporter permease [Clostridium chrysemydis]|uniref:ABC transporter permease n=1 Tax=Clostridium chrysemydis TaxID=2665504 RepID=UPI001883D079|nr:ABC transporter permease [Clostridium chrysemydis]